MCTSAQNPDMPGAAGGGPVGQGEYIVQQGDCIATIAKGSGHFWKTIWNDAANSGLRQARRDPWVLLPGDRVHVPELRIKHECGATEQRHRFRRKGEPHEFRIQLLDDGQPRANEPYWLEIDGVILASGNLDGEGKLLIRIPGSARRGTLRVGQVSDAYPLAFGGIDPISELTGVQQRLNNLGFPCGQEDGILGAGTRAALKRFQRKHKLSATGDPDQATRDKLKEAHGS